MKLAEAITEMLQTCTREECEQVQDAIQARLDDLARETAIAARPTDRVSLPEFITWVTPPGWDEVDYSSVAEALQDLWDNGTLPSGLEEQDWLITAASVSWVMQAIYKVADGWYWGDDDVGAPGRYRKLLDRRVAWGQFPDDFRITIPEE